MTQTLYICMLNADVPVPAVHENRATTYGQIFHSLLCKAAKNTLSNLTIKSTDFDVKKFEYPINVSDFDAIVISGSANSAYDDLEWIHNLTKFIKDVYHNKSEIKIFGSCFGHQLIGHSLLGPYDVRVERDPKGWELGVREITLHPKFRKVFSTNATNGAPVQEKMRLQFIHHDHVLVPRENALPASWLTLGSTSHCAVQGVYDPGRILTFQGHFEFDRFVNGETLKFFFPDMKPESLAEALKSVDKDDDAEVAAKMVLDFFLEDTKRSGTMHEVVMGLITPPMSE
ncbi:class I glutamine amidotransferase-like protein [Phaeosphaeria sp. MPI-PUGE-AT-0046c]|nr:class I glutamine amidotransferase-like protein [Phaeosphaeria sp. MPI-PUGE-AT-0046c]